MRQLIKYLNLFFFFLMAPIIGFYFAFYEVNPIDTFNKASAVALPVNELGEQIDIINQDLVVSFNNASDTKLEVENILLNVYKNSKEYEEQKNRIEQLTKASEQQIEKSDVVLEQVLSNLLGDPIAIHKGDNSTIKVYSLVEAGYRGYMAKITPHTSDALKLVLANDKVVSDGETTSQAAKRTGAILAVNAGGYWNTEDGKKAPLGITVIDGEIKTFYDEPKLSFVGFNESGHLIGGKYNTPEEIKEDNILQGSSFRPTLLQAGEKIELSSDLAKEKHPRTIVGNFSNNDLLFMVVDGRRTGWSSGVTLEKVQDKLLSFKVKDAFNLDGGGSSAFYFKGEILNKPSDGRERPVTSNLIILPWIKIFLYDHTDDYISIRVIIGIFIFPNFTYTIFRNATFFFNGYCIIFLRWV